MHTPYTTTPDAAFLAAQAATGIASLAVAWTQRNLLRWGTPFVLAGIVCVMLANPLPGFLMQLHRPGVDWTLTLAVLRGGAWCFLIGALLAQAKLWVKGVAIVAHYLALEGNTYFTNSTWEVTVMHLCLGMAVVGLIGRGTLARTKPRASLTDDEESLQDIAHFVVPTAMAVLVGKYVLRWGIDSSDEWAYTFQAHTFAKLESFSKAAPCGHAFQNYWVFDWEGRRFSQYTPGWPLFMVPFVWAGSITLAAPFSLGALGVVTGRLARRLVDGPARAWAASMAVLALTLSTTVLINGGSRFPHIWVTACFGWTFEALFRCSEVTTRRARIAWGAAFGLAVAWILASRVPDGLMLGTGIFIFFVVRLFQRRVPLVSMGGAVLTAGILGGWTLWVLHKQLGTWFATGYSIAPTIHAWVKYELVKPKPDEWRWGYRLATGAYCWFPASVALGLYGLARARKGARAMAAAMLVSAVVLFTFYSYVNLARGEGNDFGYGPRYQLATILLWSTGTGAAVSSATLQVRRGVRSMVQSSAVMPFLLSSFLGALFLAPLLYPINTDSVMQMEEVNDRVHDEHLRDVIVITGPWGTGYRGGLDYTQNLPLDLYPNQSILVTQPTNYEEERCLHQTFPERSFWQARGNPVVITPSP